MNLVTHLGPSDWAALFLAVAVKGTLILLLAFLVVGVLRRASAATRHAVWTAAFAAVLALPVLYVVLPGWQVPVLPGSTVAVVAPTPPAAPAAPAAPWAPMARPTPAAPTPPAPSAAPTPPAPPTEVRSDVRVRVHHDTPRSVIIERRTVAPQPEMLIGPVAAVPGVWSSASSSWDWPQWLLLIWAVGALFVAARWFFGLLGAWRLVQRAEPVYDLEWLELKERIAFGLDLEQPVRLLRSDRITVPVACGLNTPVVLLPAEADEWPEDRREVVLTHELAHIIRRDCTTQLIAQAALVIHWFNPLAWLGYRRSLLEREHACDDYVLNNGNRASDYAEHLMHIARRFRRDSLALDATAPMARRSNLEGRILSILDDDQNRTGTSRSSLATLSVLALVLVLPLAAFQPVEAEPEAVMMASAEPLPVSPVERRMIVNSDRDDFEWEGRVAAGGFVEVYGINGSIRARTGSGDRVRVEAEKESDRGREDEVDIVVREFANGVVICAVYPGQRDDCRPGHGADGNVRDNDVNVKFHIELPETVRLVARTVNGSIKTETLGADVEAHTVNGSVETASRRGDVTAKTVNGSVKAEAAGIVRAGTVNGSINARMGRANWDGELDFSTTNGSITLDLPDDFSAEVHAEAGTGSIKSDFPLNIRRDGYTGASAKGRVGSGGRLLHATVLNGSIKLRRASGDIGMRSDQGDGHDYSYAYDYDHDWDNEAHAASLALVGQALADIGPEMERAMEEAGRAMAEIDFEGEIASALAEVDWADMQLDIEQALAEVEASGAWDREAWEAVWEDAENEVCDALDDIRDELEDLEAELAEDGLSRAERQELREARQALRQAERELERSLHNAQQKRDR